MKINFKLVLNLVFGSLFFLVTIASAQSNGITVRARGVSGVENVNLRVAGSVVASWTMKTAFDNYSYTGNATGSIQVEFTNDATGRDVFVDYIYVNGETRQAENMSSNTAVYANGRCGGGGNSEAMHCNGAIQFGFTYDCLSGNCNGGTGSTTCGGYVGITFDDGPTSNTSNLVNLLKQHKLTPVTWFAWGARVAANPSLVAQMRSVGVVQNHSYTHPRMTGYSYQAVYDEMNRTNQAIQNAGSPKPTLYRPPYGETNSTIQQAAQALGLRLITWDVDSQDWNNASTSSIVNAVNRLQNGQVILMHDGIANTNNALSQIANNLRSRGLCPGRIDPGSGRAVKP